jgi:hypothetical protein
MNRLDTIIDALETAIAPATISELVGIKKALAAARELKALKPLAYYNKKHETVITAYELGRHINENDVPLFALDEVTK